ncbi:inositol polyphosphate 1-phosphatase-like [Ctenocephalides felis]|uniref:inositol polyphosphate 1-phosphatase-like n=1 Tax=Ctenocephalides felis TaxID=7515 RepID=UPI000E6E1609|nr:inositol polyphosphate 1-phosphatase-like [Ctenocephalides felis]
MYFSTIKLCTSSNMTDLLKSLILVSEKAANIARICRQNEYLFSKLIEEKKNDANPRFFQDFKTLADVLIQESVRHDISTKFPELHDFIHGEENNKFSNTMGESIIVSVKETEAETCALLQKVCDDGPCAEILAKEVHREITHEDIENSTSHDFPTFEIENMKDMAIWIDPIDATLEYIRGDQKESSLKGVLSNGLICATVLIGVYSQKTGEPILGIINQPFHTLSNERYTSKIYWGVTFDKTKKHSEHNIKNDIRQNLTFAVSSNENEELINYLQQCGVYTVPLAGAGYKILNVIIDNCDCFILSRGSTYKWDTCGPHAILRAMGGGIIQFAPTVSQSMDSEIPNDLCITYNKENKNSNGLIAYKDPRKLQELLTMLCNKYNK